MQFVQQKFRNIFTGEDVCGPHSVVAANLFDYNGNDCQLVVGSYRGALNIYCPQVGFMYNFIYRLCARYVEY